MIVASVSSIPRPGADLRPDPSSHARTGPTTKTRWTTAPISRRRASPSARSSSTRTRLARPGSRRTPRARRTALGSTLTCGAASITAWRPSCSRTRSEGRDVAARAPLLLIVSTTIVSSGGDGPFNSFQSRVVCIRRPGRVYKAFPRVPNPNKPYTIAISLFDFLVTICSTGGGKPPENVESNMILPRRYSPIVHRSDRFGLAQTRARLHARERHRTRHLHARVSGSTFTRDSLRLSVSRAILRAEPAFA